MSGLPDDMQQDALFCQFELKEQLKHRRRRRPAMRPTIRTAGTIRRSGRPASWRKPAAAAR